MLTRQAREKSEAQNGTDKGYDTADFVKAMRKRKIPPVAANSGRKGGSAIDGRTTGMGYTISERIRKTRRGDLRKARNHRWIPANEVQGKAAILASSGKPGQALRVGNSSTKRRDSPEQVGQAPKPE
jgi:hypothetical protein